MLHHSDRHFGSTPFQGKSMSSFHVATLDSVVLQAIMTSQFDKFIKGVNFVHVHYI